MPGENTGETLRPLPLVSVMVESNMAVDSFRKDPRMAGCCKRSRAGWGLVHFSAGNRDRRKKCRPETWTCTVPRQGRTRRLQDGEKRRSSSRVECRPHAQSASRNEAGQPVIRWKTSSRWTGTSAGATTPSFTRSPSAAKTVTVMPSPMTMASPRFRLRTNMVRSSVIEKNAPYGDFTRVVFYGLPKFAKSGRCWTTSRGFPDNPSTLGGQSTCRSGETFPLPLRRTI
jgi:hypothetical protein